ncbi:MAG TPA: sensor histidine kinase [Candidatus Paceibacterota bacterium]|nr:sensor histidine kinase [Candidatus Paceibacterota bacterium]
MNIPFFPKKTSLRIKFAIPFVGIATLPLVLVTVITIQNLQSVQREQTANLSRLAAQEAAAEIEGFIELQFEVLKNIGTVHPEFAKDPVIRDILLERFLHRSSSFIDIALLDQRGQEVARKNLVEVVTLQDLSDRAQTPEFQHTLQDGSYVGPFLLSAGKPFFVIGREIRGIDGAFQGAVIAKVDARTLQDVVTRISFRQQDIRTYIVNQEGRVLAHPDVSEVLGEQDLSFLPPVQRFIQEVQTTEITQTYKNELGETVLGTGILFNQAGRLSMQERWFIMVEQPTSIALAPVRQITQFSLLILGFMLLLSFVGALFIAHSFAKPIRELQKGAAQIGLGNLDYAFRLDTNDELEDLAVELDKMRFRLRQIRSREENLSKLKSEFVSIVAHQLRTPLSALKWALSLFEETKEKIPADQKDLLQKMTVSNERMIRLVNDLLDAARIEEGRFVYNRTLITFEDLAKSVLATVKQKANQKKVTVTLQKPKETLPSILVDKEALGLALQNLVENAIHYTLPKGKVQITAMRSEDSSLLVSVEDTGIGIAKEEKERIFSKFFRGTNAIRLETEGSGLGLFIVKNIVEAHGGKIWFESTQNKGTTFHFTVPLS